MTPVVATRDTLLSVANPAPEVVHVPDWGINVYVRQLTAGDALELLSRLESATPRERVAAMLAACLSDADGRPLLTADEAEKMLDKAAGPIMRLFSEVIHINALGAMESPSGN